MVAPSQFGQGVLMGDRHLKSAGRRVEALISGTMTDMGIIRWTLVRAIGKTGDVSLYVDG